MESAIEADHSIAPYAEPLPPPADSRVWVSEENIADCLNDQWWRLNNLYQIVNKDGKAVRFDWNYEQTHLWHNLAFRNVLLKGRQFGGTTAIDVFFLDTCLFNPNHFAGIIAHTKEDASKIFATKVRFPYEAMHPALRERIRCETDSKTELIFENGSSVRVGVSMRSGTLKQLHVSEIGKIAAKYPEKAREIKTGAVEAVSDAGTVILESTAEGRGGWFHDVCTEAMRAQDAGKVLSPLEYKFHFYTWWHHTEYQGDPDSMVLTHDDIAYFQALSQRGIRLTDAQCAWYVAKAKALGDDVKREYPSYPEEAFEASHEGLVYGRIMTKLRQQGRIGDVPWNEMFPVSTFWDLGLNDFMAIWFVQMVGYTPHLIDYVEGSDEGWAFWAKELDKRPYRYNRHYMPHDINQRNLGLRAEKRIDIARSVGIRPIIESPRPRNPEEEWTQVDTARMFLARCRIDAAKCAKGIDHLDKASKVWDDVNQTYKNSIRHDEHSNCVDALRTGAVKWYDTDDFESMGGYEPEPEAVY